MPRIPTAADFEPLRNELTFSLHFPDPPESTTCFLLLFHGLGDTHAPFSSFATALSLPGVLAISVRGPGLLPAVLVDSSPGTTHHFWGDDVLANNAGLDPDPGFSRARALVWDALVQRVIVGTCGWRAKDVIIFGFGEGATFALGLGAGALLRGVISIGGVVPASMTRKEKNTPVLAVQMDDDAVEDVKEAFKDVKVVRWVGGVRMPGSREEMMPVMQFFADRLREWA